MTKTFTNRLSNPHSVLGTYTDMVTAFVQAERAANTFGQPVTIDWKKGATRTVHPNDNPNRCSMCLAPFIAMGEYTCCCRG